MVRFVFLALVLISSGFSASSSFRDLHGRLVDPFSSAAHVRVFLFVRTDCPITNRYAPELQRIAAEFAGQRTDFWLVYPDPTEKEQAIENHIQQYKFPGTALFDPKHQLVTRAHATVAPEAAVFDGAGKLVYHGRIDDRYVSIGKSRPGGPQTHDLERAIASTMNGKPVVPSETRPVGCSLADVQE